MAFTGAWAGKSLTGALVLAVILLGAVNVILSLTASVRDGRFEPSAHGPSRRLAAWADLPTIRRSVSSYRNTVAPRYLRHLDEYDVDKPFSTVYAISSWLDSRPLLAGRDPQIAIIASMQGKPFIQMPTQLTFPSDPLHCYIVASNGKRTLSLQAQSTLEGLPDPHEQEKEFVGVQFNCPLHIKLGSGEDWKDWDIYVTLSVDGLHPPARSFVKVQPISTVDVDSQRSGEGQAAMCLPPLTKDLYAPIMEDHLAYYRALGFTKFYVYLLDPGRETLRTLRTLSNGNEQLEVVRWGIPRGWTQSATKEHLPTRQFVAGHPNSWNIRGLDVVAPEDNFDLSGVEDERDVRLWYFGQTAAQQDCAFRAMRDNVRWVLNVDWDEFVLMQPPNGELWPAIENLPATAVRDWVAKLENFWYTPTGLPNARIDELSLDVEKAAGGMLPHAVIFQSQFLCTGCEPSEKAPLTEGIEKFVLEANTDIGRTGVAVPTVFKSPVRGSEWYPPNMRSKVLFNPWAFWSSAIHFPGLPYAEHALTRAYCKSPDKKRDAACASSLLHAFGFNTLIVGPPKTSHNATTSRMASDPYSRGSLYHARLDTGLAKGMLLLQSEQEKDGIDLLRGKESVSYFTEWRKAFAPRDPRLPTNRNAESEPLVEDWTLLEVMALFATTLWSVKARHQTQMSKRSIWSRLLPRSIIPRRLQKHIMTNTKEYKPSWLASSDVFGFNAPPRLKHMASSFSHSTKSFGVSLLKPGSSSSPETYVEGVEKGASSFSGLWTTFALLATFAIAILVTRKLVLGHLKRRRQHRAWKEWVKASPLVSAGPAHEQGAFESVDGTGSGLGLISGPSSIVGHGGAPSAKRRESSSTAYKYGKDERRLKSRSIGGRIPNTPDVRIEGEGPFFHR